jgi:hypothetical protein
MTSLRISKARLYHKTVPPSWRVPFLSRLYTGLAEEFSDSKYAHLLTRPGTYFALLRVYALEVCKENLEPEKRTELLRAVEALDQDLTKWCDDLPPVFKSHAITERDVSMGAVLCSHYYSVLTILHRNFLPVRRDQFVSQRSVTKAVSSARATIHLAPSIKNVVPPSHHLAIFIQNVSYHSGIDC